MTENKGELQRFYNRRAKVAFDNNGYIVEAKNLLDVMWGKENLDEEVIGKHITEFAALLKRYEADNGCYDSFMKIVFPQFNYKDDINIKKSKQLSLKKFLNKKLFKTPN